MAIDRGYVPNHKVWDRMGRITPNVEYSHSERPHFESFAAPWLPTQRYDQEYEYYIVVSAGKVVAEDRRGHIVPAGLRKAWNKAAGTTVLSYTATDAAQNVIDLTTGVAVTGAVSYTQTQLTDALRLRGLIKETEYAMDFISKPIGVSSYNYWKAAGPDHFNPGKLYQHNFRPQALVAVTCDYCITVPVVPNIASTETMANDNTAGAANLLSNQLDGTTTRAKGWFSSTQINAVTKYASDVAAGDDLVCYMFDAYPLAYVTDDTPMTASVAGLVSKKSSLSAVSAAGDYYIDHDLGLLFVYESGGNAIPSPWAVSSTITYYHYESAVSAAGNTYMCATGDLNFGDFLTYNEDSNLIKANLDIGTAEGYTSAGAVYSADPDYDTATDAAISLQLEQAISNHVEGIVGQIIGENIYPRGYLERVKTAYSGYTAANMRTPGSATGGRSDQLTYTGAAEKMIIVNLIMR
jgi:hypothetical protein